jgi:hypothetical protein
MEAEPPDMRYQALPGNEYNHLGLLYENSELFKPRSIVTSGTVVKVRNSGDLICFVDSVTPAQLQNCILNSIISVQGF